MPFKKGFNVHVFDNLSTGNLENLPLDKIKFYNIDLKENYQDWPIINASCIYHFAANADVRGGIEDHNIDLNENLLVTKTYVIFQLKMILKNLFLPAVRQYMENQIYSQLQKVSYLIKHHYMALVNFLVRHLFKHIQIMNILNLLFSDLFHG